ncbi:MAG: hypothetical protein KOO69_07925 [Victivallales bacterium]|nr:hypothetical protein [Victivallales bacterium]
MIEISAVNEYLTLHLQADFWTALDNTKKNAAFKMATDDVCAYLGIVEIDPLRIFQLCAVSEQAVFLAEHYDKLSAADQIKSEKIDGVGAREYHQRSHASFSPRALTFLERESEVLTITRG